MKALVILFFCGLPFIHFGTDYEYTSWFIGLLGAALFAGIELWRQGHKLASGNLVYFTWSCLYISCYSSNRFTPETRVIVGYSSFYFLASIVLILASFQYKKFFNIIPLGLKYFCLVNSFYVITGMVFGFGKLPLGTGYSGFVDYASINGVLIACMIPFLDKRWMFLPVVTAIAASKSSAPWGAMAITLVAWKWDEFKRLVIYLLFLFGVAGYIERGRLFDDMGRFPQWKIFMRYWYKNFNLLFGTGPGTFKHIARQIQIASNYGIEGKVLWLRTHLHNDWLELIFQCGIVGFLLFSIWYLKCLLRLVKKNKREFASLIGLGAASVIVFPCGYFWGGFLGMYLMYRAEFK